MQRVYGVNWYPVAGTAFLVVLVPGTAFLVVLVPRTAFLVVPVPGTAFLFFPVPGTRYRRSGFSGTGTRHRFSGSPRVKRLKGSTSNRSFPKG